MRVRISYSVDLDDVPDECARMLEDSIQHLSDTQEQIERLIDILASNSGIGWQVKDRINECREKLAKLDSILADNDMILAGYYTATEPEEENSDVE
jgi:ferritin-like metal-binding protein YciE